MITKPGEVIVSTDILVKGFHFDEPYSNTPAIEALEWAICQLKDALAKEKAGE